MTPERTKRLTEVILKRQPGLGLVLENVNDPHNISAVMRTADAVGVQDIYILNTNIGLHKKWGEKSSSSASRWLTIHQFTDLEECFDAVRENFDKVYTTHLAANAVSVYELNFEEKIALVFGNEHSGVSEEAIKIADGNFIIPQVGIIKSLNISVACAVTLYEAYRQKSILGHYEKPQLSTAQITAMKQLWSITPGIAEN